MSKITILILAVIAVAACQKEKTTVIEKQETKGDTIINSEITCDCPDSKYHEKGSVADTVFSLSKNKIIALCGYRNENGDFSEFTLSICNSNKVIDFWGAVKNCRIESKNDTLYVSDIKFLPVSESFKYDSIAWNIEKIYFDKDIINRKNVVNTEFPKYTSSQITEVLSEYEKTDSTVDEQKMRLANKLFIATVSGSNKAREYFEQFPLKMKVLDGAYAEEYHELAAMLKQWDSQNKL